MAATGPHISLVAETIGHIGPLPVTNAVFTTWVLILILVAASLAFSGKVKFIPSRVQSLLEFALEGLDNLFSSVLGKDVSRRFFPLLATFFLFIILANWSGLIPGIGAIGLRHDSKEAQVEEVHEDGSTKTAEVSIQTDHENKPETGMTPLFRAPTADINTTLALALIAVLSIQYYGLKTLGVGHIKKYINLKSPIMFFVGLLEIISEFSRIISFTFRLFGNIFAGEVLLAVIAFLVPYLVPLPFLGMEIFVGFIQALVFTMLTATFLSMALSSHDEGHSSESHSKEVSLA